jgi:hypothetical protein
MGQVHKLRTRRLTDAELLRTDFRVDDPENLPGLNPGVPDRTANPTIIGFYDERPPGGRKANPNVPFIRCCHCGKRRHWKGYVIRDDQDQLYIIGASQCGYEHYGARFGAEEKAFREDQARKRALIRWQNMLRIVPGLSAEIETLLSCDELRTLERKRDEIRRASPKGFSELLRHHRSGNPMLEIREYRDYAAEAERDARFDRAVAAYERLPSEERRRRRDQGLKPERDTTPILRRESHPLGVLEGADFLSSEGDARDAALELRETLRAIDSLNNKGTDQARSTELSRLLREMTDRPKRLRESLIVVSFSKLFFARGNLERLERWSSIFPDFAYFRSEAGLLVEDSRLGRKEIAPLPDEHLPRTPTIDTIDHMTEDFLPILVEAA